MRALNVLMGVASVAVIILPTIKASAVEIPRKYRGLWTWSDSCEQTILRWSKERGEFPFLIITSEETTQHESSCKIVVVEHADEKDKLAFECSGEGQEWELSQEWSISEKSTEIPGAMGFDRLVLKVPTLVVSDPENKLVYTKCGAVCVEGKCWGKR